MTSIQSGSFFSPSLFHRINLFSKSLMFSLLIIATLVILNFEINKKQYIVILKIVPKLKKILCEQKSVLSKQKYYLAICAVLPF